MADKAKDTCVACKKTVYAMEKISVENKSFHENCFKCAHCKKKLSPGTYTALEDNYYCKPHYTQLFTSKGNYSEGFGKEKPTAAWTPITATYEGVDSAKKTGDKKEEAKPEVKPAGPPGPPGPPPPAPPPVDLSSNDGGESGGSTNAHAAALEAIRTGGHQLRHLSKEERKQKPVSSVVPGDAKPKSATVTKAEPSNVKKGLPELKLEGLKWLIRYQEGVAEPIKIAITDMKQSITINDCSKCTVIVQGKSTNISVVNCKEVGVIFDDIIATVEVVRSQKLQIQANGKVAQIAVDKSSGVDIFIQSEHGKEVEIVSSISDSINVNFPGATEDDDPIEFPVPSQFTSTIKKGHLETHPVEHV